jgi:hypothetical protein
MRKEFDEPRKPMKVVVFLSRFEAFNKERKGKYQTEYQIDSD